MQGISLSNTALSGIWVKRAAFVKAGGIHSGELADERRDVHLHPILFLDEGAGGRDGKESIALAAAGPAAFGDLGKAARSEAKIVFIEFVIA